VLVLPIEIFFATFYVSTDFLFSKLVQGQNFGKAFDFPTFSILLIVVLLFLSSG
jgi:hypothetical protein